MPSAPALGSHPVDSRLSDLQLLYLRLLVGAITRSVTGVDFWHLDARSPMQRMTITPVQRLLGRFRLAVVAPEKYGEEEQLESIAVSPADADTMMGVRRTTHLVRMLTALHVDAVPGDLIEAGCWRGGSVVLMKGFLEAVADPERTVVAIDSFAGYPPPPPGAPRQMRELHRKARVFDVSRAEVERRIARYGFLDEQVRIVEGWLDDVLPTLDVDKIALLKIDVDGYEATLATLEHLWPKLSDGGLVYVEDGNTPGARRAITDFRSHIDGDAGPLTWVPQDNQMAQWWVKRPRDGSTVTTLPGEPVS